MAEKIFKAQKKKIAAKKVASGMATSTKPPRKIVLVGTYKDKQLSWIKRNGVYNYPVKDGDEFDADAFAKIKELWLYADAKGRRYCFTAEFVGKMTRDEFLAAYPTYANLGMRSLKTQNGKAVSTKPPRAQDPKISVLAKSENREYYVFKTSFLDYGTKVDTPEVLIRAMDFAMGRGRAKSVKKAFDQFRADGEFAPLAAYLPTELSQVPRERLRVCEAAVQMNFIDILDNVKELQRKIAADCDPSTLRFIDLFAGIGGIRKGFEQACAAKGLKSRCVFTSEIKPHAIEVLKQNHPDEYIHGDITQIDAKTIPDFDILLGGFPCQAFSAAGKRLGFEDTRGTLFFDVARIIKEKKPLGFVLENVEGLVNHDKDDPKAEYGKTLRVILATLDELGYKVSWRVLNASDFGVPQDRKRIYIVGARNAAPDLTAFATKHATIGGILEHGLDHAKSKFIDKLLAHYTVQELEGKAIKDKRGGKNNIHSWDFEYKGAVSARQRELLNDLLRERRKHQWAEEYGIDWMDGMPLTIDMIRTFFNDNNLEEMLEDLVTKRYVVKEYPKRKVKVGKIFIREQDPKLPLGYNIVAGKMSFEISKVMSPEEIAPTLVAMDMQHLYVVDGNGLRTLTLREGLGLFGYPRDFKFNVAKDLGYDLLGNTVVVPVIKEVAGRLLNTVENQEV